MLGKTPLVVNPSECPGMRFSVMMNMDYFLKQIEPLQALKDWAASFKSGRYYDNRPGVAPKHYFSFDTPVSRSLESGDGALDSIGPVYDLSSRASPSRICALFIPRGVKREAFYQLMPPPGTFPRLKGTWPQDLRSRYHLSDAQADTALECLTRCGKYEVTVSDPFTKDTGRQLSFTAQTDGSISIMTMEIPLLAGHNDNP